MSVLTFSRSSVCFLAGAVVLGAVAPNAWAGYTEIRHNKRGEPNIPDILGNTFGTPVDADGLDWVSETLRFRRMDDDLEDQVWPAGSYAASAEARFTEAPMSFGYSRETESGIDFVEIFQASGSGFAVEGAGAFISDVGNLTLAQGPVENLHTSIPGQNPDVNGGRDHLVSYEVEDRSNAVANGSRTFMLFWEDLTDDGTLNNGRTRSDFNDLAVLLTFSDASESPMAGATAAPLPAGIWAGAAVLGGLATVHARRRRRA